MPDDYDMFRLEGKYNNKTFRQSFSVDFLKCNLQVNPNCKNETEQLKFFKEFFWTFYILEGMVQFTDENLMQNPIGTQSKFHSQFMLDPDIYRDQNTFVQINTVEVNDNRFSLLDLSDDYHFIDSSSSNHMWSGRAAYWNINSTRDDGKTFKMERQLNLYSNYFFMSDLTFKHSRHV